MILKTILSFFLLFAPFCFSNDSEFIIPKKIAQKQNLGNSHEKILSLANEILDLDILLNEFSIDLRKFIFKQVENCISNIDGSVKKENYYLKELESLKNELDKSLKNCKKKLFALKKKFKN